jgi:Flp pilus assembly protein TadG
MNELQNRDRQGADKRQGGQAIVLVTLALFAMFGLMGLAVDLGWSFFLQRSAQSAADAAALGAVQEAKNRLGASFASWTCPGSPGATDAWCTSGAAIVDCTTVSNTSSNLYNGCRYAVSNGFDHTNNVRQTVNIRASDSTTLPALPATASGTPLGVKGIVYWVTVSTVQTVPQIFSSMLGNTTGTISAIATAAIVSSVLPGSFYGMNMRGDCMGGSSCGKDIDIGGNTTISAPGAIVLSSPCTGSGAGCAGQAISTGGNSLVDAKSSSVIVNGSINTVAGQNYQPTPAQLGTAKDFLDPTRGLHEPPIMANSQGGGIKGCAIPGGVISGNVTLGPYNYFSYTGFSNGNPIPDGRPITITGNATFDPTSTACDNGSAGAIKGTTGAEESGTFKSFFIWGGMNVTGSVNFSAGQFFLVGQNPNQSGGTVFSLDKATVTDTASSSSGGTMLIFTAPGYPGMDIQSAVIAGAVENGLKQGSVDMGKGNGTSIQLLGVTKSTSSNPTGLPSDLSNYSGVALWMDRRNSIDYYNPDPGCTAAAGNSQCGTIDPTRSAPQATSGEMGANYCPSNDCSGSAVMHFGPGDIKNFDVKGVIYMPRGAYYLAEHGNGNASLNSATQFIGGGYKTPSGNGIDLTLTSPTNPFLVTINALIQ